MTTGRSPGRLISRAAKRSDLINAGRQLLPKAGAQRTLEAVSCTPLFGAGCVSDSAQTPGTMPTSPAALYTLIRLIVLQD